MDPTLMGFLSQSTFSSTCKSIEIGEITQKFLLVFSSQWLVSWWRHWCEGWHVWGW